MKRLLLILVTTVLILSLGCAKTSTQTAPETPTQIIEDVTTQAAASLIESNQDNPDFVILDVRTPAEFAQGHIEKAINLDYNAGNFRSELDKLDKNKIYLVYCQSGGRSKGALTIMAELGFVKVYNMLGGFSRWQAEGRPIVQ